MTWHDDHRLKNRFLRHLTDSEAWKYLDISNSSFARDSYNFRLNVAAGGINSFGNLSISHSTCPIINVYTSPLVVNETIIFLLVFVDTWP